MPDDKKSATLGQAIDQIIDALTALDEAKRPVALRAASELLGLTLSAAASGTSSVAASAAPGLNGSIPSRAADIKTLKEQKQPRTAIEMSCLVAFYLQELAAPAERRSQITSADIDTFFRQAAYPLPKAKSQLLVDAKAAGYFDSAGSGSYKLNAVGYNLVAHTLPRSAGESSSQTRKVARRSKKPKQAGANKKRR